MLNRYVDGRATLAPGDPDFYRSRAEVICRDGHSSVNKQFLQTCA